MRVSFVDVARLPHVVGRILDEHGAGEWEVGGAAAVHRCADGALIELSVFPADGPPPVTSMRTLLAWRPVAPPLALLLARRGHYAVGLADAEGLVAHKRDQRYVQSRTSKGGSSQGRYARRRSNQADALVGAVADRLAADLSAHPGLVPVGLVAGGDRLLVERVLTDARLARLADLPRLGVHDLGEPTHALLVEALRRARAVRLHLLDPPAAPPGPPAG